MIRLAGALVLALSPAGPVFAQEWVPVVETNLEIAPGSPLDFSAILPNTPINESRRLAITADGHFAVNGNAERFLCASLGWGPASGGLPDHADADLYARQLAMHGYNLARLHFQDATLMDQREGDFDFDPETLDRMYYLLAALKREGIYWVIDGLTSWRGGYGGFDDRWDPNSNLKLKLYFDATAFEHWRMLQEKLYASVNPYTGLTTFEDPALALVVMVNEGGIEFDSVLRERGEPHYDELLAAPFNAYLRKFYDNTDALRQAWTDLAPDESLEAGTIRLPPNRYPDSARHRDLQGFFVAAETGLTAQQTAALRDLGYGGAISNYNNWTTVQTGLSRETLPVVTMNTYQDWVGSIEAGASLTQASSVDDAARYMREIAAARWLGRPFVVTEYDQLFWNKYRYEAGLVLPAYAALQDWDGLCRHGQGPIVLAYGEDFPHKRQLQPYAIALDPVARAGETLAALLFRRGDVQAASAIVPFSVTGLEDLNEDVQAAEPDELTTLALVARIGLSRDGKEPAVLQPREGASLEVILAAMKSADMIDDSNATFPDSGRYESDTGQVELDSEAHRIELRTPRTEAAAFRDLATDIALGALTLHQSDGAALVSASALDDEPLETSRRILIIFATDARNIGMHFANADDRTVTDMGHLPAVIRPGRVDLSMRFDDSAAWVLSPVGLDGNVGVPIAQGAGDISHLPLENVNGGRPTTFFLLQRQP